VPERNDLCPFRMAGAESNEAAGRKCNSECALFMSGTTMLGGTCALKVIAESLMVLASKAG
jgi:hypothetical protein